MSVKYIPFRPSLHGHFATRFYKRVRQVSEHQSRNGELSSVIKEEVDWALNGSKVNPAQRRIYRATWLLIRDLDRVGWIFRWHNGTFEVAPPLKKSTPTNVSAQEEKANIRQVMSGPRLERIAEARDFIERMEKPSSGRAKVSITTLIADGEALARDLSAVAPLPAQESKILVLRKLIQPYLQLVREDERCQETGHKLSDIWRYFRFTWATPSDPTPGRTMLYLIRDKARPYHPVMGIASLENAALAINARDTYLGWTPKAFQSDVETALKEATNDSPIRLAFTKLLGFITAAIQDINLEGLCTRRECERPTEPLLLKIAGIVSRSIEEQRSALRDWHARGEGSDDELIPERSEMGNSSKEAVDALYRRKRADQLGRLLAARLHLQTLLKLDDLIDCWKQYVADERKRRAASVTLDTAIRTALQAVKNRHVGTSMLELNVCGAIPPYNELLGGKLVALLMLSPQVVRDYSERYGGRPSDIASMMKGEPVIRPAELIFVGTTSLYHVGSSQYNRLKLPAGLLRSDAPEVRWRELGETSGFGTLHVSKLTARCLEEAANEEGETYVHHIFGEGMSPKLRQFRHGLDAVLGASSATRSAFTKHEMSRLIYGAWLASNGPAIFRGSDENPSYYFDPSVPVEKATDLITDYWRQRWLVTRLSQPEILERIRNFNPEILRISNELRNVEGLEEFKPIRLENHLMPAHTPGNKADSWRDFVRGLYLGTSAYADYMDLTMLEAMHVKTSLDVAVVNAVKAGKSVVLTGNPGDGKTHLLRVLTRQLERLSNNPVVELDASTLSNAQIKAKWEKARKAGRPFCIAINEAILKGLADEYRKFEPIQEAQRQVEQAVVYGAESETTYSVVVFDLSQRNALTPDIVNAVIGKLADPKLLKRCSICPAEGCDLVRNQTLLGTSRFKERLQLLLNRVSVRGRHATLRELQNLISYLLFAGRSCEQLLRDSGDQRFAIGQLPFKGKGKLFKILKEHFDPAGISHPLWDEALVSAETDPAGWLPEWPVEDDSLSPNDWDRFKARKRAFYFFHANGDELLVLAGNDESEFESFLRMPEREALRLIIRRINSLFGISGKGEELRVWQSHRYNQSPRQILYSSQLCQRSELEIVHPRLRSSMAEAFELTENHILLRLKRHHAASLRVDFALFHLLQQAERGVPVLSLEGDVVRRLWQFMEQLYDPAKEEAIDEVKVVLLDRTSGEQLTIIIDPQDKRYLSISRKGGGNDYSN